MTNSISSGRKATLHGTRSLLGLIAAPFRAIGTGLMTLSERSIAVRMRQIDELNRLTDAELARRGLRRDDIVRHVFRGSAWM